MFFTTLYLLCHCVQNIPILTLPQINFRDIILAFVDIITAISFDMGFRRQLKVINELGIFDKPLANNII